MSIKPAPRSPEFYQQAVWWPIEPLYKLKQITRKGVLADRNQITAHITEGGADARGSLSWYENITAKEDRFGAHFYISQDGTVYQTSLIGQTTLHASQVNAHAIGVEHAASSGTDPKVPALPVSEAQYKASSKLIRWIASVAKFPIDRAHVRSHWEASPADQHRYCCMPTLDLDRLVQMAQAVQA